MFFHVVLAIIVSGPVAARHDYAWEGFEREISWDAATGSAATGRIIEEEIFSEGGRSLKLLFKTVAKGGKAVYSRWLNEDWSPFGALLLDVYNPSEDDLIRCAVLIETTDRWIDHEYQLPPLKKGWNRDLRVDLKAKRFIAAASNYQPSAHLVGRGEIRSVGFLIYPGAAAEGAIYLDNLRLERAGVVTAGPVTLNTTIDLTASTGSIDYLPPEMRVRPRDLSRIESFEGASSWASDAAGITIAPADDFRSHGRRALSVSFPAVPDGFDLDLVGMENRLAGTRQLRMDIYNAGPPVSIRLQLDDNGDGESDYNSDRTYLLHGWNTRIFDFTNQNSWSGTVIDDRILTNLTAVSLNVASRYPGRLVFDGLAASDIRLSAAAKGGAMLSLSYNPHPNLEFIGDLRVEDTVYGNSPSSLRSTGAEAYLDAGTLRFDSGEFRTRALYRRKINRMDLPMYLLVSPDSFGREIAGIETGGRALGMEIQGLLASRLEYDRYNSRRPTGFGPEGLATLRLRRNVTPATRVGVTHITHLARYGSHVPDVPEDRHTWGLDVENHAALGPLTLNSSLEGGVTGGDVFRGEDVNAPRDDRYYVGAHVSPEIGRLGLYYNYTLIGHDFDYSFMTWGGNYYEHSTGGSFNLENFSIFSALDRLPLYDRSVARNLEIDWIYYHWWSRDRYRDPDTGQWHPRNQAYEFDVDFANDEKARPNFRLSIEHSGDEDQWTRSAANKSSLDLRLPLPWLLVATASDAVTIDRQKNKVSRKSGRGWRQSHSASLERYFKFNLFLSATGNWEISRESWEGVWGSPDSHFKFTSTARQTLGANTTIEIAYGRPALLGYDFGIQDTINVYTLTVKSYF